MLQTCTSTCADVHMHRFYVNVWFVFFNVCSEHVTHMLSSFHSIHTLMQYNGYLGGEPFHLPCIIFIHSSCVHTFNSNSNLGSIHTVCPFLESQCTGFSTVCASICISSSGLDSIIFSEVGCTLMMERRFWTTYLCGRCVIWPSSCDVDS